ncbi:hypothetical protein BRD07_07095 [Halobacteriales archaeon QS_9_68_42]|nr:MAG: hypothetical protein BRD07_07095 [Halobacteriales archaeon QS_9_68_42]
MSLWADRRGQSVVIGSLLIFTFLILAFSGYQTFIVPSQNQQVEAEHFQETEDQFSTLRSNILNSIGSEETRSTAIELGTGYPVRQIALNPPPAAGRLATTEPGDVEITSDGTTGNVCRADGETPTTRSLVYTPGYNEYGAPEALGYENRVVSGEFRSGRFDEQRLVRESSSGNDRISLFLLNGSVDEYGVNTYSLEVNASRQHTKTLDKPKITIPSRFDATTWRDEILADYSDVTVTSPSDPSDDRVILSFDGKYEVSCAVVGLSSDPAFTPPDDSGGGPSDSDSGGGYDVQWLDPSGETGTSCSGDPGDYDCTLDASQSQTLDLTAETKPRAQDATVDFLVSNGDVATITPAEGDTGSDGKVSARVRAQSDGEVKVYADGGDNADLINFTITNCPPDCGTGVTVVYTNGDQKVSTAKKSVGTTEIDQKGKAVGPLVADIDGDDDDDILYVNGGDSNSKVYIADPDGSDVTELSSTQASGDKSLLGVGRWDGADTSVYFADGDQSVIYRTNPSDGDVKVVNPENDVSAVTGPADIDSDDANELLYADGSQELRYFEPGAGPGDAVGEKISLEQGIGDNNGGIGLGRPADFNGDDTARIPVVDGSNRLILVNSNGDETVLVNSDNKGFEIAKSPVATVDWDDDGKLEIVYLTKNNGLKYVDDVTESSQTVKDTEIDEPRDKTGVA